MPRTFCIPDNCWITHDEDICFRGWDYTTVLSEWDSLYAMTIFGNSIHIM
jgi:hypothetical protein